MKHNEDSRVKLPALLHFLRLGYKYQTKHGMQIDLRNNIFIDIFRESIGKINSTTLTDTRVEELLKEIHELTTNRKDLGKSFYDRLKDSISMKLIDFNDLHNNDFRVVTELPFFGEQENFRPDIIILVNGIPLSFLEVKKPNNSEGIQAEFKRNKKRMEGELFYHFFNQLQLITFSNNLEYRDTEQIKMSGSFYSTPSGINTKYNHFREEAELTISEEIEEALVDNVLIDNNALKIKNTSEFKRNILCSTPCNSFITSVFSPERFLFFLKYGIVYVDSKLYGLQKHIIRYPQYFAIQSTVDKISRGMKRGVIWHTQGSGKTSLAYYLTNILKDYFQGKGVITKFYFVVDRLDLLVQASGEFSSRNMQIANINNKAQFISNIKSASVMDNVANDGVVRETMNVVNIQKFSRDAVVNDDFSKKIQRVYFLDEVHRSYKIGGEFLANLLNSDPNAIFIGLTGTPVLKEDFKTTDLFSGYIHKYYYNKSIADGYTLKIKKENISTQFKSDVQSLLELKENEIISPEKWKEIGKNEVFIDKICDYIEEDFKIFREEIYNDKSLGFMIVTSSTDQAKKIQEWFDNNSELSTALVLSEEDYNSKKQEDYRGEQDPETLEISSPYSGVVVYKMLLTGFDAPRLKRLYLLRRISEHNLLQTLARVNRPYKQLKYGYIVDFVDVTEEYEETNRRYLKELREDIDDIETFIDVNEMIVDIETVKENLQQLKRKRFLELGLIETNLEEFRNRVELQEIEELRDLKNDLLKFRECYNELRIAREAVDDIPIEKIDKGYYEVNNRIKFLNDEIRLADGEEIEELDLSNMIIEFIKKGEIDLEFTTEGDIHEIVQKILSAFNNNLDKQDEEFISLKDDFRNLILDLKHNGDKAKEVLKIIENLTDVLKIAQKINSENHAIMVQYNNDESSMRLHKVFKKNTNYTLDDYTAHQIILDTNKAMYELLGGISPSEEIVKRQLMRPIRDAFSKHDIKLGKSQVSDIVNLIIKEKFD